MSLSLLVRWGLENDIASFAGRRQGDDVKDVCNMGDSPYEVREIMIILLHI